MRCRPQRLRCSLVEVLLHPEHAEENIECPRLLADLTKSDVPDTVTNTPMYCGNRLNASPTQFSRLLEEKLQDYVRIAPWTSPYVSVLDVEPDNHDPADRVYVA